MYGQAMDYFRSRDGKANWGGAKYDISMVFVYAAFDRYLKENGKLAFLITQSVFQSDAGYGFRKFYYTKGGKKEHFKIESVYDLVEINPFEGASNRTSFFTATKGEETSYPVQYTKYEKKRSIGAFVELSEALESFKELKLWAKPVKDADRQSKWLIYTSEVALIPLKKVLGESVYKGLTGCYTEGANGVFWVTVIGKTSDNCLLVKNITKGLKKAVKELTLPIEPNLVYPLLRGGEAKKWFAKPNLYIIFTSKHWKDKIKETNFKVNFPKTYAYFYKFKDVLNERSSYFHKLKPQGYPFYTMYGSTKMLKPFKVVWQRMGSKLSASVVSSLKSDYVEEKPIIPQETIIFVPFEDEKEAHYVCSILNSSITEFVLRGYSMVGGKSFASAHVLTHINIPKFKPKNKIHIRLAELPKRAHTLAKRYYEQNDLEAREELKEVEERIDKAVAELYGITDEELEEVKKTLGILKGEDGER
ncbi:MAG: BREX-1 system adenine-specific DNA-methyltransferase PglX [Methanophagales archaeon]|nr:BREX-1 system adenine-specific DNA-methyltransferase PglX [Methanophagales archaeon]